MNKIFTQLVENRHLTEDFLHPKYEKLTDPLELPDMTRAINRLKTAIKSNEKILIYGDYDVDGVTSSTLMESALKLAGVKPTNIEIMLPDRFIDGYGMSPRLITRAREHQISLVITVDCGSRNHSIIEELNREHIDTIVTDHHECEDTLPEAVAVVNPHRHDFKGPETLKHLAGVGVAFKLAQGLEREGLIKSGQEKWLLDLVLLGTICDSMLLEGENRILTYFGKIVLEKTRRPGLIELIKIASVKSISAHSIGFQLGPRLNAAGRLKTAEISLNLLRTNSATEAAKLAVTLEELNNLRRTEQQAAVKEITERMEQIKEPTPVIIETGTWHEGILGIIAGRLVEQYHQPAFVLSEVEDGIFKGSGRSFGDFNLADALNFAKDVITGGGGHAAAAGVQLKRENLYAFREKINAYYESLNLKNQDRFLRQSADLDVEDLTDFSLELADDLSLLEPFGPGNEEPIFCLSAEIANSRRMGTSGTHLCLELRGLDGKIVKAIAFGAPEGWFSLNPGASYRFLVRPTIDEWRGARTIEAHLLDILD